MHTKVSVFIITTNTHKHYSPEDRKTFGPDVLATVLDTSYQVRYKLMDGALVLDRA